MFRRTRLRPTAVSIILLLTLVTLPTLIGVAQERLQLGGMTYSRAAAAPLSMPVTMSRAFFRGVGGVAFNAVAQGQAGLTVRALRYEASAPDGQRLVIDAQAVDGTRLTVRGHIYDWELLPTARFALDDNGLAVTLFGQLQDGEEANRVWETGGRVINYHRRLDNTLLGLRLLQADMLIIAPEAADLFRVGGRVLLGAGERGHDVTANRGRFATVAEWQELQDKAGNSYQSVRSRRSGPACHVRGGEWLNRLHRPAVLACLAPEIPHGRRRGQARRAAHEARAARGSAVAFSGRPPGCHAGICSPGERDRRYPASTQSAGDDRRHAGVQSEPDGADTSRRRHQPTRVWFGPDGHAVPRVVQALSGARPCRLRCVRGIAPWRSGSARRDDADDPDRRSAVTICQSRGRAAGGPASGGALP